VDVEFAMRAVETGQPFHVIHFGSAYKFDIFPGGRDRFSRPEMARRRLTSISGAGLGNLEFPVSSPEDTILAKLRQVRQGGEVSDRQWNDAWVCYEFRVSVWTGIISCIGPRNWVWRTC